jgi:outer membrane protein
MMASLFRSVVAMLLIGQMAGGTAAFVQAQGQDQSQTQAQSTPATAPQAPANTATTAQGQNSPQATQSSSGGFVMSTLPDYSHGKRWFPDVWAPYTGLHIDQPEFVNSPRIDQLISNGKMMLSLADAIALALENNLDISVQRFQPWIAETDILRAKAGGIPRGSSGTGTASALGNIPLATFDPVVTSNLNISDDVIPVSNPFTTGTGISTLTSIEVHSAQTNFLYSQAFHTGTSISIGWNNTRSSTTSPGQIFNPQVTSSAIYTVQQQLLNGFGLLPNTRFILEAKNSKKYAELTFSTQVVTSVTQVKNFYWELVYAREAVKVQEAAVATSQKLYEDNKKQVQIGTLAPIEVVRAESQAATDQQNLIVAQTTALQDQTNLLNAITKNPLAPELQNVEIIPTEQIPPPGPAETLDLQAAVQEAWQKRPELQQAQYNLKNAGIEVKATKNALLPTATLYAQYGPQGLGGNLIQNTAGSTFAPVLTNPVVGPSGTPILVGGQPVFLGEATGGTVNITPGGLHDALSQIGSNMFPSYIAGLSLTIPIRNRSAQADNARALLDERLMQTQYRQQQNTIFVAVRNAQIALQQDRVQVIAAGKARVLAQETLDAEQKKYQLGASTSFLVISDQRDLTAAQGTELRAKINLVEAQVNYEQALGRTLESNNITVAGGKGAHVYGQQLIPGAPSTEPVNGK